MKTTSVERLQSYRRFYLPFVYGLATANFVAVIQLVSAPQLSVDWSRLIPPQTSQLLPFLGFSGMMLMSASIPTLLCFALFTELALRAGHYTSEFPIKTLSRLVFVGIMGPGLALFAFHFAFGLAYFAGMIATMIVTMIRMRRFKIEEDSN